MDGVGFAAVDLSQKEIRPEARRADNLHSPGQRPGKVQNTF